MVPHPTTPARGIAASMYRTGHRARIITPREPACSAHFNDDKESYPSPLENASISIRLPQNTGTGDSTFPPAICTACDRAYSANEVSQDTNTYADVPVTCFTDLLFRIQSDEISNATSNPRITTDHTSRGYLTTAVENSPPFNDMSTQKQQDHEASSPCLDYEQRRRVPDPSCVGTGASETNILVIKDIQQITDGMQDMSITPRSSARSPCVTRSGTVPCKLFDFGSQAYRVHSPPTALVSMIREHSQERPIELDGDPSNNSLDIPIQAAGNRDIEIQRSLRLSSGQKNDIQGRSQHVRDEERGSDVATYYTPNLKDQKREENGGQGCHHNHPHAANSKASFEDFMLSRHANDDSRPATKARCIDFAGRRLPPSGAKPVPKASASNVVPASSSSLSPPLPHNSTCLPAASVLYPVSHDDDAMDTSLPASNHIAGDNKCSTKEEDEMDTCNASSPPSNSPAISDHAFTMIPLTPPQDFLKGDYVEVDVGNVDGLGWEVINAEAAGSVRGLPGLWGWWRG